MAKKILLMLGGVLLALGVIEILGICFFVPGHLYNVFRIIEPNQQLLWHNRANLHQRFYTTDVMTNKEGIRIDSSSLSITKTTRVRILTLGASPTFGWGVEYGQTYSAQLEHLLSRKVQVINSGQIGFSSEQGRRLLPKLLKQIRPKIVLIPYVINDVDHLRFIFDSNSSDRELLPVNWGYYWFTHLILNSHAYWALQHYLQLRPRTDDLLQKRARVSLKRYLENMAFMAQQVKKSGAYPIFLVMPVNLPGEARCSKRETDLVKLKKCLAAKCSHDALRYNSALKSLAIKLDVELVDVASLLLKSPQKMFLVEKGDPIHPSAAGHEVIARQLVGVVERALTKFH